MKEVFEVFLTAGLSGSVLILAVILVRAVLCKAPKRHICLLWLLVGLRLLLPFTIESSLSLQPDQSAVTQLRTEGIAGLENPAPAPVLPDAAGDPVADPAPSPNVPVTEPVSGNVSPTVPAAPDYTAIAAWVWLAGAGAMLAYTLISYHLLKYKLRGAVPLQHDIFEDPAVRSPFLLGYLRPRIYLPCHVPEEYRSHILAHERCHIRRGDNWVKLTGFVCLAVHWYNPLVWLAYSLLCRDMEMACDEAVIRSMDTPQRKAYSAALLSCAAGKQAFSACPVAFGEDNVKRRIMKVLHYRKPAVWLSVAAVLAVAVLIVCFLTDPLPQADPTAPEETDPVERCRLAVAQLQGADSYAITENRQENTTDDRLSVWDTAFHLRSGDDRYHRFERSDWIGQYFFYNGRQLVTYISGEELTYSEWTNTDLSDDPLLQHYCWLLEYQWDTSRISLKEISPDGMTVTLSVQWEESEVLSEELQFCFDGGTGKLESVSRTLQYTDGFSLSTVSIHSDEEADIAATLSTYYQNILSGSWEDPFSSGAASVAILTQPSDWAYETYKSFFYSLFGSRDKVIFADVTHDGEAEMLVLHTWGNGELYNGYVYTTTDGVNVKLLDSNQGGEYYAGGRYGWYLKPVEDGYNLAEETFNMGNGIGTLRFEEYYLHPDGQRVSVDLIYVSSDDPESRDESGAVSEEAADRYAQQLYERISAFYLIYSTYTESGYRKIEDSLWQFFQ